jgi:hypothetical protein
MIVKQEVEATPELVIDLLRQFASKMDNEQFPYPRGTLIVIKEIFLQGVQGIEGMPAIVLGSSKGTALGQVAIQKNNGDITMAFITKDQVEKVWNP